LRYIQPNLLAGIFREHPESAKDVKLRFTLYDKNINPETNPPCASDGLPISPLDESKYIFSQQNGVFRWQRLPENREFFTTEKLIEQWIESLVKIGDEN
jgi:hypothetical protein